MNKITTKYYTIEFHNGIVEVSYNLNLEMNLQIATLYSSCLLSLIKDQYYPILLNTKNLRSIDYHARQYLAEIKLKSPVALLCESLLTRYLGNFFIHINKPKHPVKLYTNRYDALVWLQSFVQYCNPHIKSELPSYEEAMNRLIYLKNHIEHGDGYRVFRNTNSCDNEELLHHFYYTCWFKSDYDVNREVGNGRGFVDYKISKGSEDVTLVEFKLASNSGISNVMKQVQVYENANNTKSSIIAIVFFTDSEEKKLFRMGMNQKRNIVLIDARQNNKISGSKIK